VGVHRALTTFIVKITKYTMAHETLLIGGSTIQLLYENAQSFNTNEKINFQNQNGRHVMIDNGIDDIQITCNGNVLASYQVLGTGTVTCVAGAGRTLASPNGAVLTSQYSTASISFNGTTDIILVNNV
jgi:hypothetical protein